MSIENGHLRYKRHIKQEDGTYKLVSQWTSSDTVHMEDGTTLESKVTDILEQVEEKAPLNSPELTGTPKAPTAANGTNTTQIATTEFVQGAINSLVNGAPETMNTLNELAEAIEEHQDVTDMLNDAIIKKVDKVDGKGLSTNDYTNEEKAQMAANKNDIAAIKEDIEDLQNDIVITTSTTLVDSKAGGYRLLELQGNTEQNGTPTPSNPIPILNYGDCVKIDGAWHDTKTGAINPSNTCTCNKYPIPCKSGDIIRFATEDTVNHVVFFYSDNGYLNYNTVTRTTESNFTVPNGATYFNFDLATSPQTVGKIQLTVNGKYLGCIKGHGKNFCTPLTDYAQATVNGVVTSVKDSEVSINSTSITAQRDLTITFSKRFTLKKDTPYTFSLNVTKGTLEHLSIYLYDALTSSYKASFLNITSTAKSFVFTPTSDIEISSFLLRNWNAHKGNNCSFATQIEEGTVATPYEPYKETIAWYYTNEPIRLGDVKFKDSDGLFKIQRNVAEVVLNGGESWGANNYFTNTFFIALLNNMKSLGNGMCSHYVNGNINNDSNNVIYIGMTLNIRDESATTVDEFKAKLQASPIALQYELATPTIEVLDTQSQINLNSIETFDGVTYLECDSRVKPLGIKGEYGTTKNAAYTLKACNDVYTNTDNGTGTETHTHSNKTVLDNTTASYTTAEQTKLAGIAAGANAYTHPNSGVTAGTYRSVTVNAQGHVTAGSNPTTLAGYGITDAADKTHTHSNYLTGITKAMVTTALGYTPPTSDTDTHYTTGIRAGASGTNANSAATNGNVYLKVLDNTTYRGQVKIVGSGATTVTSDASGNITISSTNTTYSKATTSADGLCPKLPASDGTWKYLRSDGSWGVPTNTTYSAATQSAAGLMSAADKKKLDGIATGANAYTLPQATSLALGGVYISDAYTTTTNSSNIAFSQKGAATLYAAVAPKAHATTATTYGAGTASNYGHVKVSDNYTSSAGAASSGIAASSYAVATAYSTLNSKLSCYITATGKSGNLEWRKWSDGHIELWGNVVLPAVSCTSSYGGIFYGNGTINLPSGLFTAVSSANITILSGTGLYFASVNAIEAAQIRFFIGSALSETPKNVYYQVYVTGS
jgi:hypothetical protein